MHNNGYNYRTLNPWEQTALEHLSAMIGEIIGAGFDNPNNLIDRVSNMVSELSYWNTQDNWNEEITDEEITEILDASPYSDSQQYGASEENGDKKINPTQETTSNFEEDQEQDLSQEREYEDTPY